MTEEIAQYNWVDDKKWLARLDRAAKESREGYWLYKKNVFREKPVDNFEQFLKRFRQQHPSFKILKENVHIFKRVYWDQYKNEIEVTTK